VTNPQSVPVPRQKYNLRGRLTGALALVVLFAGVVMGFWIISFVRHAEERAWQNRQQEAAQSASRTVERFIDQVQEYMGLVGSLDRTLLVAHPQVTSNLLSQNQALLEIIRLDPQGTVFASANQGDAPVLSNLFTIPQSSWFLQALQGRSYVGDLQLSATNKPYIILAAPAADGGVVAARLRMDLLWDVVSDIRFGKTGQAYIADLRGNIVAHANPQVVLDNTSIAGRPEMVAALQAPDHRSNATYHNFADQNVLGITLPIADSDWLVFTEVARSEALATVNRALLLIGGSILLLGAFVGLATSLVLRRLVFEPVEELHGGAERVGQGDLDYRLQVRHPDEIGQVAATFNLMAGNLKEREAMLAQARDEATAASRFKSRLLANVSHDLRTPLNVVLGYADMMNDGAFGSLTKEQRDATERILVNTRRLISLIGSLLDQAQIEAGKMELSYKPFKPADLLADTAKMMTLLAQRKGLALATSIDPSLPSTLEGDPQRLQQILMNLVENAIKFTAKGTVGVRFYLNRNHWVMEVSDSGRGIPAEAQSCIFDPFEQVDGSLTRDQAGVGLGLAIVRQLTSLMNGQICLVSEIDKGSTFSIFLPIRPKKGETI